MVIHIILAVSRVYSHIVADSMSYNSDMIIELSSRSFLSVSEDLFLLEVMKVDSHFFELEPLPQRCFSSHHELLNVLMH